MFARHDWAKRTFGQSNDKTRERRGNQPLTLMCCNRCGVVQNLLNKENPCKGFVAVGLRSGESRPQAKGRGRG